MAYSVNNFTYGAELEYADWRVSSLLPAGCNWNRKDNSIVNSSGIANDPKGILHLYGGEINTRPTTSIASQVEVVDAINRALTPAPAINYRCNLHIHIGCKGLNEDLEACKRLLQYIYQYQQQAFDFTDRIPAPIQSDYPDTDAYQGALKRYRRRKVSHQFKVSAKQAEKMLSASTTTEFFHAHTTLNPQGRLNWFQTPRAGINLRQLWEESQTIEFRHFPGTLNLNEIHSALIWCQEFLQAAIITQEPIESLICRLQHLKFPKFCTYRHDLEEMYLYTTPAHHSYKVLKARFAKLKQLGILE